MPPGRGDCPCPGAHSPEASRCRAPHTLSSAAVPMHTAWQTPARGHRRGSRHLGGDGRGAPAPTTGRARRGPRPRGDTRDVGPPQRPRPPGGLALGGVPHARGARTALWPWPKTPQAPRGQRRAQTGPQGALWPARHTAAGARVAGSASLPATPTAASHATGAPAPPHDSPHAPRRWRQPVRGGPHLLHHARARVPVASAPPIAANPGGQRGRARRWRGREALATWRWRLAVRSGARRRGQAGAGRAASARSCSDTAVVARMPSAQRGRSSALERVVLTRSRSA